ncbi:hypothetical protein M422DRAFT_247014 [Sphaerobolus stellatus SS14]|nr:hypothetical protein M422DRAFT_247014 [Sphaerobolus stellatus SS14]
MPKERKQYEPIQRNSQAEGEANGDEINVDDQDEARESSAEQISYSGSADAPMVSVAPSTLYSQSGSMTPVRTTIMTRSTTAKKRKSAHIVKSDKEENVPPEASQCTKRRKSTRIQVRRSKMLQ